MDISYQNTNYNHITVDEDRLWKSLMDMALIGATSKGGCNRIAFSKQDDEARSLFYKWCESLDLKISFDAFGNMFAYRAGKENLPPVVIGSHLDTQPTGGKFDGILGVIAGLEVVRTLVNENIQTKRPIIIVNWTNEEGVIMRPMLGSAVFTGGLDLKTALLLEDGNGNNAEDLLSKMKNGIGNQPLSFPIHSYLELHIEQGPILEDKRKQIGIVTGGFGFRRYQLNFTGEEAHAGPTPMTKRKDAMLVAAKSIIVADEIAKKHDDARATSSILTVHNGSPVTVAASVSLILDIRFATEKGLQKLEDDILEQVATIAIQNGVSFDWHYINRSQVVHFDKEIINTITEVTTTLGYSSMRLVSGAGHDACNLARKYPSGMIFAPSVNGLSHNEAEYTKKEDCTAAANVLLHSVLQLAQ